jgi:hypothetical protein
MCSPLFSLKTGLVAKKKSKSEYTNMYWSGNARRNAGGRNSRLAWRSCCSLSALTTYSYNPPRGRVHGSVVRPPVGAACKRVVERREEGRKKRPGLAFEMFGSTFHISLSRWRGLYDKSDEISAVLSWQTTFVSVVVWDVEITQCYIRKELKLRWNEVFNREEENALYLHRSGLQ